MNNFNIQYTNDLARDNLVVIAEISYLNIIIAEVYLQNDKIQIEYVNDLSNTTFDLNSFICILEEAKTKVIEFNRNYMEKNKK
jgi:hypothetical protein